MKRTKQRGEHFRIKITNSKQHVKLSVWLRLNGNNNSPIISLLFADEEYPFQQTHTYARVHIR